MILRSANCPVEDKNVWDGIGDIHFKHLATRENMYDHARIFAHLTIEPGHSIGDHPHNGETEFYYVIRGEGEFNDDGVKTIVHPGDLCETGHGAVHGVLNTGTEPLEMIALIVLDN